MVAGLEISGRWSAGSAFAVRNERGLIRRFFVLDLETEPVRTTAPAQIQRRCQVAIFTQMNLWGVGSLYFLRLTIRGLCLTISFSVATVIYANRIRSGEG